MPSLKFSPHDFFISEEIKARRRQLCVQWDDFAIFDSSVDAARVVLFYKEIERARFRDYNPLGKCFFFWDREDVNRLNLIISKLAEPKFEMLSLEINDAGFLSLEKRTYASPQKFLDTLSLEKNFVYQRVKIEENTPLWSVLSGDFPETLRLEYPPDYPPLLGDIAVTNRNFATALQILKHPSMYLAAANEKNKYQHFLSSLGINAASKGSYCFLQYLISNTPLMDESNDENVSILSEAMCSEKNQAADLLLKLYSPKKLHAALEACLILAVLKKKWKAFEWAAKLYDGKLLLPEKQRNTFLMLLLLKYGSYSFVSFLRQWEIKVDWSELIAEMAKTPRPSTLCLDALAFFGGDFKDLNEDAKLKLLEGIVRRGGQQALEILMHDYPSFKELLPLTVKLFIEDEKKLKMFLDMGVVPTREHFIALFKLNLPQLQSFKIFRILLNSIADLEAAKKTLAIVSIFGEKAVNLVFERFPELTKDSSFVFAMAMEVASGAALFVGRRPNQDDISLDPWSLVEKEVTFTPAVESAFFIPLKNKIVSVGLLYNFLVPIKDFEKLYSLLLRRSDCIFDFWKGLAFLGIEDFSDFGWSLLAKNTLPLLARDVSFSLLKHLFYYSHLPLAELILRNTPHVESKEAIALFETSLFSGDVKVVKVLADCGFLFASDENGQTLLHIAAKENLSFHAAELIKLGIKDLPDNNGFTAYDIAINNRQITLCRLLRGDCWLKEFASTLSEMDEVDIKTLIWKSFLNSSSCDVLDLLNKLQDLRRDNKASKTLEDLGHVIKFPGTLIVRFLRPVSQQEMLGIYSREQHISYEIQQLSWAEKCEELYQEFFSEFQSQRHPVLEILMNFSRKRGGNPSYDTWRFSDYRGLITHFSGRYFSFWKIAQRVYRSVISSPSKYRNEVALIENGYQIYFKGIPLTKNIVKTFLYGDSFEAKIIHTESKEITEALSLMHNLFEEIKAFPLEKRLPIPPELKKKIALLFWIGCHTVATARGSSQYMVMLHRLAYNLHGFQPAPWSQKYVQPDCVALMLPFDWFYEEFYDDLFDFSPLLISEP